MPDSRADLETPPLTQVNTMSPVAVLGKLAITMRRYAPRAEALDGRWNPPPARRVP